MRCEEFTLEGNGTFWTFVAIERLDRWWSLYLAKSYDKLEFISQIGVDPDVVEVATRYLVCMRSVPQDEITLYNASGTARVPEKSTDLSTP
jgi:hypothetical protein